MPLIRVNSIITDKVEVQKIQTTSDYLRKLQKIFVGVFFCLLPHILPCFYQNTHRICIIVFHIKLHCTKRANSLPLHHHLSQLQQQRKELFLFKYQIEGTEIAPFSIARLQPGMSCLSIHFLQKPPKINCLSSNAEDHPKNTKDPPKKKVICSVKRHVAIYVYLLSQWT